MTPIWCTTRRPHATLPPEVDDAADDGDGDVAYELKPITKGSSTVFRSKHRVYMVLEKNSGLCSVMYHNTL